MVGWRAALGPLKQSRPTVPWFEDLHTFEPYIAHLNGIEATEVGEQSEEAAYLAEEVGRLHAALVSGLERPSADDVIARYVAGEIGDRTAQYVLGLDAYQLIDECVKMDLPPMQVVDVDQSVPTVKW